MGGWAETAAESAPSFGKSRRKYRLFLRGCSFSVKYRKKRRLNEHKRENQSVLERGNKEMKKKTINITKIAIVALWPSIFLLIIGIMEHTFRLRDALSFQLFYSLFLIPMYIFAGCVFAFYICFCYKKEFIGKKITVYAYVFSALMVILYCVLWALTLSGTVFIPHAITNGVLRIPPGVFSFVLGFTIFTAIRAILLYRKTVI